MKKEQRKRIVDRHRDSLTRFGYSSHALYWSSTEIQELRFKVLAEIGVELGDSILDVGCGFADFKLWFEKQSGALDYTGIDLSPDLMIEAAKRHPDAELIVGDLFDMEFADCDDFDLLDEIAAGEFTAVMHQAAITDTTVMDQRLMVEVNTNAFASILAASAKSGTRVVYASSAGTYGNSEAPNSIGSGEEPENIYGFSKLAMDRIAARWYDKHPASIVGLRYFNVYGPGEHHKNEREGNKTASMILQMYQRAKAGEQLRLFKHGEQMRDFVYIRDVIAANLAALEAPRSGVCNVGSGKARTFNDIVENLGKQLGQKFDVEYIDNPFTFYQMHTEADLTESKAIMGWEPAWSLEKGIEDYVRLLESGHRGPAETA